MQYWELQVAKDRMSELVKRAQEAPQGITIQGNAVAVVISQASFETLSQAKGSLFDFMQASPLAGSDDPDLERKP
jgi:prevent-host-death family protein